MKTIVDDALCAMVYGDNEYAWNRLPDALSVYQGQGEQGGKAHYPKGADGV